MIGTCPLLQGISTKTLFSVGRGVGSTPHLAMLVCLFLNQRRRGRRGRVFRSLLVKKDMPPSRFGHLPKEAALWHDNGYTLLGPVAFLSKEKVSCRDVTFLSPFFAALWRWWRSLATLRIPRKRGPSALCSIIPVAGWSSTISGTPKSTRWPARPAITNPRRPATTSSLVVPAETRQKRRTPDQGCYPNIERLCGGTGNDGSGG